MFGVAIYYGKRIINTRFHSSANRFKLRKDAFKRINFNGLQNDRIAN